MDKQKSILVLILLVASLCTKAQEIKINEIEQYKIQLQKSDEERKARIEEYVKKFNYPKSGYTEAGNYFFIHHIDEMGMPIYYETKGGQEDSVLKLKSIINSASSESLKLVEVKSQSVKKNRILKLESAVPISSIVVLNDKGKVQYTNQSLSKNSAELKMAKWLDGNYSIIILLKNNQTYITNIKL